MENQRPADEAGGVQGVPDMDGAGRAGALNIDEAVSPQVRKKVPG